MLPVPTVAASAVHTAWNENKDNMNEVEKTNLKRLSVYAGTFLVMQAVSMLLAGWRDDDENLSLIHI